MSAPIFILVPDDERDREVRVRMFYELRMRSCEMPAWRDDPSYFWAEQAKARREAQR